MNPLQQEEEHFHSKGDVSQGREEGCRLPLTRLSCLRHIDYFSPTGPFLPSIFLFHNSNSKI